MKKTILLLLLNLFLGCNLEDTCNARLGNTFSKVGLIESKFNNEGDFLIQIEIEALDTLPYAYFEDYVLIRRKNDLFGNAIINSSEILKTIDFNKQEMNISIFQDSLPSVGNIYDLFFYLKFPDRKGYLDCTHPGGGDSYYLNLEFRINRIEEDSILLSDFQWQETFNKGGF